MSPNTLGLQENDASNQQNQHDKLRHEMHIKLCSLNPTAVSSD